MKYSCNMIQDLIPLYIDGVCSEESKEAVEQHLSECPDCKAFYTAMCEEDQVHMDTHDANRECQKAASFQAVKKRIRRKQILTAVISVVVLLAVTFAAAGVLKRTVKVVEYNDNISASMVNGSLVGRLQSSRICQATIKRVEHTVNGQEKTYLFFCAANTQWDAWTTGDEVFSEYTLCPLDKNADQIDAVYYYTGEYEGMETLSDAEFGKIVDGSALLWHK